MFFFRYLFVFIFAILLLKIDFAYAVCSNSQCHQGSYKGIRFDFPQASSRFSFDPNTQTIRFSGINNGYCFEQNDLDGTLIEGYPFIRFLDDSPTPAADTHKWTRNDFDVLGNHQDYANYNLYSQNSIRPGSPAVLWTPEYGSYRTQTFNQSDVYASFTDLIPGKTYRVTLGYLFDNVSNPAGCSQDNFLVWTFTYDKPNNNPAYFSIQSPSWNWFTCNNNVTFYGRVTDNDNPAPNTQWSFYEGTRGTFGWGGPMTLYGSWWVAASNNFSDGWHRWQGNAYDPKWGWRTDSWDQATFTVDSPPRCQISHVSPGNGWVMPNAGGCVTLQGNVSDPDNRDVQADFYLLRNNSYYWSGYGNYTSGGISLATICGLPAGNYAWRVHARDGCGKTAGYCGGDGYWWYFRVNQIPSCSINSSPSSSQNNPLRAGNYTLSVNVSNDGDWSTTAFNRNGSLGSSSVWGNGVASINRYFGPGDYTWWNASVCDSYGCGSCSSSGFWINSPPTSISNISGPSGLRCMGEVLNFSAYINDINSNSQAYFDISGYGRLTSLGNGGWVSASVNASSLSPGVHSWTVTARDTLEGQTVGPVSGGSFTINSDPTSAVLNSPASGAFLCKNQNTFTANVNDVDENVRGIFNIDSAILYGNYTSNGGISSVVATLVSGDFNWRVQAQDTCGRTSSWTGYRPFRVNTMPNNLVPQRLVLSGTAGTNPTTVDNFSGTTLPTVTILRDKAKLERIDFYGQAQDRDAGYPGYSQGEGARGIFKVTYNVPVPGTLPFPNLDTGLLSVTSSPYSLYASRRDLWPGIYKFSIEDNDRCGEAAVATSIYTISIAPDKPSTLTVIPTDQACPATCGEREMNIVLSWDSVEAVRAVAALQSDNAGYFVQYSINGGGWLAIQDNYDFKTDNFTNLTSITWRPDFIKKQLINGNSIRYRVISMVNNVLSANSSGQTIGAEAGPFNYDCIVPKSLTIQPASKDICKDKLGICLEGEDKTGNIEVNLHCENSDGSKIGTGNIDILNEASNGRAVFNWNFDTSMFDFCAPGTALITPPNPARRIQAGVNTYDYGCTGSLIANLVSYVVWPEVEFQNLTGTIAVYINPRATEEFNYSGSSISNPPPGFEKIGLPSF